MNIWKEEQAMAVAQHVDSVAALIGPLVPHAFTSVQNRLIDEIDQNLHALRQLLFRCPFGKDSARLEVQDSIRTMLDVLDANMGMLSKTLSGERVMLADPVPSTPQVEPIVLIERERTLTIFHPEGHAVA